MTTYTNVFGGALLSPVYNSFNSITFNTNINLFLSTQFQDGQYVLASIMNFNPTAGGLKATMPDMSQTSVGFQVLINNISANSFVLNGIDNVPIVTIPGPSASILYLADNSVHGVWFIVPAGGGFSSVTSINAASVGANTIANLLVTGTPGLPITTTGTINFQFTGDLAALINFGTNTGFAVRTDNSPETWALRELIGTPNQVAITANPDGVAGDPVIGLATDITGITSLQVGNLRFAGNTISAFSGSNIILAPQSPGGSTRTSLPLQMLDSAPILFYNSASTHYMSIQGGALGVNVALTLPATAPGNGQALISDISGQLSWANIAGLPSSSTINSVPKFINTDGGLVSTNVLITGTEDRDITDVNSIIIQNVLPSGPQLKLGVDGPTIISTTTNSLGLSPSTGITTLAGTAGVEATLLFYNINNVNFTGIKAPTAAAGVTFSLPASDGTAKSLMQTDGATNLSFTGVTTDYIDKGFAVFDGTGANGAKVPLDSVNIASINKTATGVYTVVVTTGFSSNNYGLNGTVNGVGYIGNLTITNGTTFAFTTYNGAGAATDFSYVTFELFGKQ